MSAFVLPIWVPALFCATLAWEWWLTQRRLRQFEPLSPPSQDADLPSVCLCMPARNEAQEIGRALDSWLTQNYPRLSIVVVDDGSTDGTTEILAERTANHPERLRVIRNDTLPSGWLGKNHALFLATSQPEAQDAEWLLFVDADVQASPDLLSRCFADLNDKPADILALVPSVDLVTPSERLFLPAMFLVILWAIPPPRVENPRSRFFCGSGAFTLVRRTAYEAVGGHAAAPMEPIDDMMLARRLKRAGFTNRAARGGPDLHLRPTHGVLEMVRGLRKNALGIPGLWPFAPLMIILSLVIFLCPFWLALGGYPGTAFVLWLVWPAMVGGAHQDFSKQPMDWILALWPLIGFIGAAGFAWAFLDALRGVNHWRGRDVRVRSKAG